MTVFTTERAFIARLGVRVAAQRKVQSITPGQLARVPGVTGQELPRAKQRFVIEMLDTVLQQAAR